MIVQIEAIDTLFFRDGKPFEMGDDAHAAGIFPPLPSAFYGAIRTAYFSLHPEKLAQWNDKKIDDPTKELKIRGVYLLKGTKPQFVIPAEMVEKEFEAEAGKKKENKIFYTYPSSEKEEVYSSSPLMLNPYSEGVESPKGFMDRGDFDQYLKDEFQATDAYYSLDSYISKENKIGIGRQNVSRTTEEGKLYRVQLNRMEVVVRNDSKTNEIRRDKTFFLVDVNLEVLADALIAPPKFIKLGGENKIASCTQYKKEIKTSKAAISDKFKLYLQTPAIFQKTEVGRQEEGRQEGGWLPDCFKYDEKEKAYIGTWKGIKLKLLRAFVAGLLPVGGFDLKIRQPKTMYRAVPAGTVYHFEILDGTASDAVYATFANPDTPLSDVWPEQGFGLSFVGLLNS